MIALTTIQLSSGLGWMEFEIPIELETLKTARRLFRKEQSESDFIDRAYPSRAVARRVLDSLNVTMPNDFDWIIAENAVAVAPGSIRYTTNERIDDNEIE
jgi:hypothetical protein